MVDGVRAAAADPAARAGLVHVDSIDWLVAALTDGAGVEPVVGALLDSLGDAGDAEQRRLALWRLVSLPPAAITPAVVGAMLQHLHQDHEPMPHVRGSAALALARLPAQALTPSVVAALLARLEPGVEPNRSEQGTLGRAVDQSPPSVRASVESRNWLLARLAARDEGSITQRGVVARALGRLPRELQDAAVAQALVDRIDPQHEPDWGVAAAAG